MAIPRLQLHLFPPDYQAALHRMLADYQGVFGGRTREMGELDAVVAQAHPPYALLLAPTGRGKTALVLHWLAQATFLESLTILFLGMSRRYQTASAPVALTALATALATVSGESLDGTATTPDQLRPLIADYLRRDRPPGQRLLVIIDGMDEAVGWQVTHELFPAQLGQGIQILGAARQLANTTPAQWLAQLGWPAPATHLLTLPLLGRAAIEQVVLAAGLAHTPELVAQLARVSEGDPLTLRLLVEAVQHGTLSVTHLTQQPPGLDAHLRDWLTELERQADQAATRMLLGICATAFGPLTATDIAALAPAVFADAATIAQAADTVRRFLIGDGSDARGYVFSHPRLRETYYEQVLTAEERQQHQQQFVAYGQQWVAAPTALLPAYLRQFWIAHLADVGAWDLAATILTQVTAHSAQRTQIWAAAHAAADGSHRGYLADLDVLWRHAEQEQDLALGVRCALIASSIRSLSADLTPELLVNLVTVGTPAGRWSSAAALEHLRQMPEPAWHRARALEALIRAVPDLPRESVLDLIRSMLNPADQARVLIAVAPQWTEPQRTQLYVEAVERDLDVVPQQADWATDVLPSVLGAVPPLRVQQLLLHLALHAVSYQGGERSLQILRRLLAAVPDSVVEQVFTAATAFTEERERAQAVVSLARAVGGDLLHRAFHIVVQAQAGHTQAEGLSALAPHMPEPLIRTAFEHTHTMTEQRSRRTVLRTLIAHLPPDLLPHVVTMVCADDLQLRQELLPALALRLDSSQLARILAVVQAMDDDEQRQRTLFDLAPSLYAITPELAYQLIAARPAPTDRLFGLLQLRARLVGGGEVTRVDQALAEIFADPESALGCVVFLNVVPVYVSADAPFPQSLIDQLWQTLRSRFRQLTSLTAVSALLRYPPQVEQEDLYADLMDAFFASDDDQFLTGAIIRMTPLLTPALHRRVLTHLRSRGCTGVTLRICADLAPDLRPDLRAEARALVRGCAAAQPSRVALDALSALATDLPVEAQQEIYHEALLHAQQIHDRDAQTIAILALIPAVRPARRWHLFWRLGGPATLWRISWKTNLILDLATRLPRAMRRQIQASLFATEPVPDDVLETCIARLSGRIRGVAAGHLLQQLIKVPQNEHTGDRVMRGLVACIPVLPQRWLGPAEHLARRYADHWTAAQVLAMVAQRRQGRQQRALYTEACMVVQQAAPAARISMGLRVVRYLPAVLATDLAHTILEDLLASYEEPNTRLFPALAPHLSPADITTILQRVATYRYADDRVDAWLELIPYLPASQQERGYRAVFTHLSHIGQPRAYTHALTRIVPLLPPDLIPTALAAARAIAARPAAAEQPIHGNEVLQDEQARCLGDALMAVLPRLPDDQQSVVAEEYIDVARQHPHPQRRAHALRQGLPYLAPDRRAAIVQEALTAATTPTRSEWGRESLVVQLTPWLVQARANGEIPLSELRNDWQHLVRGIARYRRSHLLEVLVAGMPWLATLATSADLEAMSTALIDSVECWP